MIAILGASSGIGLETVRAALDAGYAVRAFARSAGSIPIDSNQLEKLPGDALSASDVSAAVAGADVVIQSLGVPFDTKLFIGPISLFSRATALLIPAMKAAGCRRLVAVTGFGAGDSKEAIAPLQRAAFELVFGRAYRDKSEQERLIRCSGLDWTIVRPGILTNGKRRTYQALNCPQTWRNGIISRAGVAQCVIDQAMSPEAVGKTPVLVG